MKKVKKPLISMTFLIFIFFVGLTTIPKVLSNQQDICSFGIAHVNAVVQPLSPPKFDPSLVALWTFDEGSGKVIKDVTKNGHDGKFVGNPKWVNGKYGGALEFNGTSDYVEVPDADDLNITKNLTWAAWFKPSITIDPSNASAYRLMSKNNAYFFLFNYEQIGNLGFLIKDGGTNYFVHSKTNEWEKEKWYHVTGTYDGNVFKIYINGKLEGEKEHKGAIDASPLTMWIGADDLPHYFKGAIDETQVYNRTLNDAEVKNLMNRAAAVEPHAKLTTTWGRIKGENETLNWNSL